MDHAIGLAVSRRRFDEQGRVQLVLDRCGRIKLCVLTSSTHGASSPSVSTLSGSRLLELDWSAFCGRRAWIGSRKTFSGLFSLCLLVFTTASMSPQTDL